jgi:hypothetical protein
MEIMSHCQGSPANARPRRWSQRKTPITEPGSNKIAQVVLNRSLTVSVAEAISAVAGSAFNAIVASFTVQPGGNPGTPSATIQWGDGSSSAGSVTSAVDRAIQVGGAHTYANRGSHTVVVTLAGANGPAARAVGSARVVAPLSIPPTVVSLNYVQARHNPPWLVLTFSEPMDPTRASDRSNDVLKAVNANGRALSRSPRHIALTKAVYDPASRTATLSPRIRLAARQHDQLTVHGTAPSGLANTAGVLLDGSGTGKPGSDFVPVYSGLGHKLEKVGPL